MNLKKSKYAPQKREKILNKDLMKIVPGGSPFYEIISYNSAFGGECFPKQAQNIRDDLNEPKNCYPNALRATAFFAISSSSCSSMLKDGWSCQRGNGKCPRRCNASNETGSSPKAWNEVATSFPPRNEVQRWKRGAEVWNRPPDMRWFICRTYIVGGLRSRRMVLLELIKWSRQHKVNNWREDHVLKDENHTTSQ